MCGIAGIIAPTLAAAQTAVSRMTDAVRHRGPDDAGTALLPFGGRLLALGHRRLSIIDLSAAGHQPMVHPETGDQLIFNGEIYNFARLRHDLESAGTRFVGHSDTEVLLHALTRHGPDVIAKLQGMFTFAFFDQVNNRLILARDSVGIKPLYVAGSGGSILFASEVRALLASGHVAADLDPAGVAGLLAYGSLQHPLTLFKGITSFPPGHYQVFTANDGAVTAAPPVPFWTFPAARPIDAADAIAGVRAALTDSVRDHLVADVPVGVFLSSGVDSTIVAALAARQTPHLRSFTVAFADQPDMSEGALAAETAREFGLEHTEVQITGADAEAACIEWLAAMDQPSVDGLNVYLISKAIRAHGITVALAGNGGDEIFGGYPSFADVPRLARALRRTRFVPPAMRRILAGAAAVGRSAAVREKLRDIAESSPDLLALYLQRRRAMSNRQLAELGMEAERLGLHPSFVPLDALRELRVDDADPVWTISQFETRFYQQNMLLRDCDANSMARSMELRVPMLDQRVLDLGLSLPGRVRLPNGIPDKHLLRVAFADCLRPALLSQKKRGFTLPIRRWMKSTFRERCEHALTHLKGTGVLRPEGVDGVWRTFLDDPDSPTWSRAFTLCVLGFYLERCAAAAASRS